MTHRELLQDRYEDTLFALLMDGLAISQGEGALAELKHLNTGLSNEEIIQTANQISCKLEEDIT